MNKFIHIGNNTIFNGKKNLIASKNSHIIIGKYCAIANGINIITLNHDYNFPAIQGTFYKKKFNNSHPGCVQTPPNKERTKGNVIIGNDVWIGEDVFISSGVTIGDGCCIGAKSVITNDGRSFHGGISQWAIGALKHATTTEFFDGSIDQVAFYPFALSASQVRESFNSEKPFTRGRLTPGLPQGRRGRSRYDF